MHILIAEDDLFYRRILESVLRSWGYEPIVVGDGDAAWEMLRHEEAPRLAVLAWQLSGMETDEVCRRVRALTCPEPTYLLVVTGRTAKADVAAALRAGADDYLTRPFDREELQARIEVGRRVVDLQARLAERSFQADKITPADEWVTGLEERGRGNAPVLASGVA